MDAISFEKDLGALMELHGIPVVVVVYRNGFDLNIRGITNDKRLAGCAKAQAEIVHESVIERRSDWLNAEGA